MLSSGCWNVTVSLQSCGGWCPLHDSILEGGKEKKGTISASNVCNAPQRDASSEIMTQLRQKIIHRPRWGAVSRRDLVWVFFFLLFFWVNNTTSLGGTETCWKKQLWGKRRKSLNRPAALNWWSLRTVIVFLYYEVVSQIHFTKIKILLCLLKLFI